MTDALSEIRRPISYMSEHSNITAWNAKIKNNIDWGGSQKEKQEKLESAMEFWCAIICHFPPKTSCTPCVKGLLYFLLEVYHVYRASKISQVCQVSEAFQDLESRCLNPSRCLKNPGWFWQRQMAMSWQGKCELSVGGGLTDRPIPDTIS